MSLGPRVGSVITLGEQLKDVDSGESCCSHGISNRDALQRRGRLGATGEESTESVSDLLRQRSRRHLDPVGRLGILAAAGRVLDEDDGTVLAHHCLQDLLNCSFCLCLPLLRLQLGESRQAHNHEKGLVANVLLEIGQLSINGDLDLELLIQPAMVLLQHHHAVFKHSGGLGRGDGQDLLGH